MRQVLAILAVLGALTASAHADIFEFSPYAGYTTVNMGEVNGDTQNLKGFFQTISLLLSEYAIDLQNQPLNNGFVLGADISSGRVLPWQSLKLDWRNEFLQTNQAVYKVDVFGTDFQQTEQGSLTSSLLGLVFQPVAGDGSLDVSLGAFFGLGYGVFTREFATTTSGSAVYTRVATVGQLEASLNWHLNKAISLAASSGYRFASLGQMFDGNGNSMTNAISTALAGGPGVYSLDVDFSGFTASGAVSYAF